MVSFQCHGCGDVVKKPKLDQHRSRCFTGFDCIDCSKTFKSPAEYKGHTSCISEAEKYQKGLYKGPKTGANGAKSCDSPQPNSLLDKKDTTHTPVSRQSNAQWNRNTQATSLDNINGYPGPQHQHSQNGWQNGRGYSDRGRKGSNRQQKRFTGSSASGANDTPLGISRRSSVDDAVVVNGRGAPTFDSGNRADGASQTNTQAGVSEANGKPPKEKWQPKEICSSQTGKEIPTELDTERNPVAVCNDVKEDGKRKRKRKNETNGDAGLETGTAKAGTAGSDIKEKVKNEKNGREKIADEKQGLADADAVDSADKKKTKKVKKQQEAADEPVDEVDAGKKKRKKEKKPKEKNAEGVGEAEPLVAEDVEIPASVNEPTTKPKKRKKKGTADDVTENSETPVVENAAAEVAVVTAPVPDQTTKKKKKRDITETISETATHVDKEEKQKKKETRRREDDMEIDTKVGRKESKRKRQEEPNDSTKEKRRKHTS